MRLFVGLDLPFELRQRVATLSGGGSSPHQLPAVRQPTLVDTRRRALFTSRWHSCHRRPSLVSKASQLHLSIGRRPAVGRRSRH